MCGRGRAQVDPHDLGAAVGATQRLRRAGQYKRKANAHPGCSIPVAYIPTTKRAGGSSSSRSGEQGKASTTPALRCMRWGLVPSYEKEQQLSKEQPYPKLDYFRMMNCRSETVAEKPVFSRLLKRNRAVVAFNGFYEWKSTVEGKKQPYYIHFKDNRPMLMAVLFDTWRNGKRTEQSAVRPSSTMPGEREGHSDDHDGNGGGGGGGGGGDEGDEDDDEETKREDENEQRIFTFSILTTASSPRLEWLHNRMPVVLSEEGAKAWLAGHGSHLPEGGGGGGAGGGAGGGQAGRGEEGSVARRSSGSSNEADLDDIKATLSKLAVPYKGEDLTWYPVTKKMSKMSYEEEDVYEKIHVPTTKSITSFFSAKGATAASSDSAGADSTVSAAKGGAGGGGGGAGAGGAGEGGAGEVGAASAKGQDILSIGCSAGLHTGAAEACQQEQQKQLVIQPQQGIEEEESGAWGKKEGPTRARGCGGGREGGVTGEDEQESSEREAPVAKRRRCEGGVTPPEGSEAQSGTEASLKSPQFSGDKARATQGVVAAAAAAAVKSPASKTKGKRPGKQGKLITAFFQKTPPKKLTPGEGDGDDEGDASLFRGSAVGTGNRGGSGGEEELRDAIRRSLKEY